MSGPGLDGRSPVPLHGLPSPARMPVVVVLWSLPVALIGAQLLGAVAAGVARLWLGAKSGDAAPVLGGVLGGGTCLLIICWLLPTGLHMPLRRALGLRRASGVVLAAAAAGTFMLGPTADLLMTTAQRLVPGWTMGTVPHLQAIARAYPLWLLWPFFALLPGVAEELYFRGLVQNAFRKPSHGLWVSALGFAAFHVDPHHVIGVVPLGLFLAWVGMRHGTAVTIFAHVVNNTLALWTAHAGELDMGYGTGQAMPLYWVPASLVFVALAVAVLRRNEPDG